MPDSPVSPEGLRCAPAQHGAARCVVITTDTRARRLDSAAADGPERGLRFLTPETAEAAGIADRSAPVIVDLDATGRAGLALIRRLARDDGHAAVLAAAARLPLALVIDAGRAGACDVLAGPVDAARLAPRLARLSAAGAAAPAAAPDRAQTGGRLGFARLRGGSPAFLALCRLARRAAANPLPVWIEGPPGSGRTALARAIHEESPRGDGPFLVVDCAGLEPAELGMRLFGAADRPPALLEAAGGSLCLKEPGAMPPALGARLEAVLEAGRLDGGLKPGADALDVRVMATSAVPAEALLAAGRLSDRLHDLLCCQPLRVPPLAARRADIAALAQDALSAVAALTGGPERALAADALRLLEEADWPGQIRELREVVIAAALLAPAGRRLLEPGDIAPLLAARGPDPAAIEGAAAAGAPRHDPAMIRLLDETGALKPWHRLEREIIAAALTLTGGEMTRCARLLRIGRSTLYRKVAAYGLARPAPTRGGGRP